MLGAVGESILFQTFDYFSEKIYTDFQIKKYFTPNLGCHLQCLVIYILLNTPDDQGLSRNEGRAPGRNALTHEQKAGSRI